MTKYFLSALLLFATPVFATITKVQSNATWGTTSTTTCTVPLTNTTDHNLLVVWATWSPSTLSASVVDHANTNAFPSAVGPTIQSASNTAAQIVYQSNINHTTGTDNVIVTFNGTATTASCVAVEYSGADVNYPLDSASAGYGYSASGLLDSGNAVPANANLLVFGGGNTDFTSSLPSPGTGFTNVQFNFGSITEQMIVSGNNTLQRASASTTGTGHWLMQMAVFRDASWTVAGAWSPARIGQIRYADQFPGSDCGAKINAADADLGVTAGEIWINNGCGMTMNVAVTISANHTVRFIQGGTYTYCKLWTLNGNAISIVGPPTGITEDINNHPSPAVILEQASGCDLPLSMLLKGANIALSGFALNGNSNNNSGNAQCLAPCGVGIATDTSGSTTNGSRGRIVFSNLTVGNFNSDDVQITSTLANDQAIHFEMDYVAIDRAISGHGVYFARAYIDNQLLQRVPHRNCIVQEGQRRGRLAEINALPSRPERRVFQAQERVGGSFAGNEALALPSDSP